MELCNHGRLSKGGEKGTVLTVTQGKIPTPLNCAFIGDVQPGTFFMWGKKESQRFDPDIGA